MDYTTPSPLVQEVRRYLNLLLLLEKSEEKIMDLLLGDAGPEIRGYQAGDVLSDVRHTDDPKQLADRLVYLIEKEKDEKEDRFEEE